MLHGKELLQMNPYTAQNETKSQRTQPSSSTGKMPGILIQSQTNNKNQDTISFKTTLQNKSYSGSKSILYQTIQSLSLILVVLSVPRMIVNKKW